MAGMTRYIVRRLIQMAITIIFALSLNFFIINLAPGNPVRYMAGEYAASDPEYLEAMTKRWGLDKPVYERFIIYMSHLIQGDFGYSYRYTAPVMELIMERMIPTLLLTLTSLPIGFIVGVLLGAFSARRFPSRIDAALSFSALLLYSMPVFWFAIVMILIFSVNLRIFPVAGMLDPRSSYTGIMYWLDVLHHLILPVSVLALGAYVPVFYKITKSSILEQSNEEYVSTFQSYGLPKSKIFRKFILRNALIPPVTTFGISLGFVLTGAALTETVFAWPGIGRLMLDAANFRDYPLLMGIYLIMAIGVTMASFITDIIYTFLDPRVKYK
jgi:peptide/nickel transport system permease protein